MQIFINSKNTSCIMELDTEKHLLENQDHYIKELEEKITFQQRHIFYLQQKINDLMDKQ